MHKLDRATLAKFLPNPQAIKVFEAVLEYVVETGPNASNDLLALLNGLRRPNTSDITARLDALEATVQQRPSQTALTGRVGELEQQPSQRANLSQIVARLDALEAAAARRANLTSILQRIENLEKITGV